MKKVFVLILFSMFFLDCASHNRKTLLGRITDLEEKVEKLERFVLADGVSYIPIMEWNMDDLEKALLQETDVIDLTYWTFINGVLVKGERKK